MTAIIAGGDIGAAVARFSLNGTPLDLGKAAALVVTGVAA